jgi:hypothetical protein
MFRKTLLLGAIGLALLSKPTGVSGQPPAYFDQIGFTELVDRLGSGTPTGAGIVVSQIEALVPPTSYLPNPALFPTQSIIDRTGGGSVSSHATTVGRHFYGDLSIAPGIPEVNAYRVDNPSLAGDWLGDGYLRTGTILPPLSDPARVQNHSYIDSGPPDSPGAIEIIRRLDFAIARDNVVVVVGVNNGPGPVPGVQSSGYNSIAVGLTNGNSSAGPTLADGPGRSKPDIVAPLSVTSNATPVIGASASLLVQTAMAKSDPGEAAAAGRAETIKAALLSGATVSPFAGLAQPWQRFNNGAFVEPLDRRFGAGQVNIDNSHQIIESARQNGADLALDSPTGWDFGALSSVGSTRRYFFDTPSDITTANLTATVAWLRRIPQDGDEFTTGTSTLADIELRIYETDGNFNLGQLLDSSTSPVDNLQHTRTELVPTSHYAIEVSLAGLPAGQSSENFGIAWQVIVTPIPEPHGILLILAALGTSIRIAGRIRAWPFDPAASDRTEPTRYPDRHA